MLRFSALQPSFDDSLRVFQEPLFRFWPVTETTLEKLEADILKHRQEMKSKEFLNKIHQLLSSRIANKGEIAESSQAQAKGAKAPSGEKLRRDSDGFSLSLDVSQFSPEELSVKVAGEKVTVMGKHEKKTEDEGFHSYKYEEFRRDFELPEDVNPDALSCCLSEAGQLWIKAPLLALPPLNERDIPISTSTDTMNGQSLTSNDQDVLDLIKENGATKEVPD
uniref:SHSP domain-containing protein n=2 Tax=Latimeria chalumnae TaxID=7897 RepID=H3A7X7_LATCH